jgi:nicotinamide riboside kinase
MDVEFPTGTEVVAVAFVDTSVLRSELWLREYLTQRSPSFIDVGVS